jgi:hypothetical protein
MAGAALIDWEFIATSEGKAALQGYIPHTRGNYTGREAPDPKNLQFAQENRSGVTIATGFDIGQHSAAQISSLLHDSPGLVAKLVKFAGKRRLDACKALHEAGGLKVSKEEAAAIDAAVKADKMGKFIAAYDRVAVNLNGGKPFANLPFEIRTAIMDFAFQYGEYGDWKGETSSLYWKAITSQDFGEARRILAEEYRIQHVWRRQREADLYRKAGFGRVGLM